MSNLADELAKIGLSGRLKNIEDRLSAIESRVTQQELASRNQIVAGSEMAYPAKSVSTDEASPQKGGSDADIITKIEQIIDKAIYFATQPDRFNGLSRAQAAHAVMIAAENARQRQALEKVMEGKE